MTAPTITTARTEDADQVADVLAAAFTDDPVLGWLLPRAERRAAALRRFFGIEAAAIALPHGHTSVARTEVGTVGAALVLPPGQWRTPVPVLARHAVGYLRVFGPRIGHAVGILDALERRHLREPHFYLPYIGVRPEFHGRGIGTALLGPVLARADRDGLPTYLEASSPDSARLYRRLGFRTVQTVRPLGSPPLELMVRGAEA